MDELLRLAVAVTGPLYDALGKERFYGGMWLVAAACWLGLLVVRDPHFTWHDGPPNAFDRAVARLIWLGTTAGVVVLSAVVAWELWLS